jgi:hypothetical protein
MPVVCDDGNASAEHTAAREPHIGNRKLDGRAHAFPIADCIEIVTLDVAAINWTSLDGSPFHAGHLDVDRVNRFARNLHRHVEILLLGAHERPSIRRLDLDGRRARMRRARGEMSDLAVGRRAAARSMRDDAVSRSQRRH